MLPPDAAKYPLVRGWIDTEPLPFFKELREKRPVLVTPVCTLVSRYDDYEGGHLPQKYQLSWGA